MSKQRKIGPPIFVRDVPAELHARFKALCAANRMTMRKKILELVAQAIKEDSNEVPRSPTAA